MNAKHMEIAAPVAMPGDTVMVRNYRCRPARWERGVVQRIEFSGGRADLLHWSYYVGVLRGERRDFHGRVIGSGGYTLHVGDDAVTKVSA